MARILNSPLSAETVTFEYVPSGASTVSTMALSAANFIGGGSGITYSAGSGISIATNVISLESNIYKKVTSLPAFGSATTTFLANNGTWLTPAGGSGTTYSAGSGISINASTISLETSIYNTVSNLSITNTVTSDGTAIPTASAVYSFADALVAGAYVFSASLVAATVTLAGGANIKSVCQAFELGTSPVYIQVTDTDSFYMYYVTYVYDRPAGYTLNAIAVPSVTSSYMQIACLFGSSMSSTQTYIGRQVFTLNS